MSATSFEATPQDLRLDGITRMFGSFTAVDDLNLTIPGGTFFALLGASGCGKSTTLRMIAGLETPSTGSVLLGSQDITNLAPYKRPVNTVFQSYALFPHLTVFENVAFGLRRKKIDKINGPVADMLELVELAGFGSRKPADLSGGQQQRVALARALVNRPQVLLLDEPLGALDLRLRRQMQLELKRIQGEVGTTFVHVTHDQEEAMTMADTIAVMNGGRIEQQGSPTELYDCPTSIFVANFLGQSNLMRGRIVGTEGDQIVAAVGSNKVTVSGKSSRRAGEEILIGVRPEKIVLHGSADTAELSQSHNRIDGAIVTDVSYVGVSTQYVVKTPWSQSVNVFEQNLGITPGFAVGDPVALSWLRGHTFLLDPAADTTVGTVVEEELC